MDYFGHYHLHWKLSNIVTVISWSDIYLCFTTSVIADCSSHYVYACCNKVEIIHSPFLLYRCFVFPLQLFSTFPQEIVVGDQKKHLLTHCVPVLMDQLFLLSFVFLHLYYSILARRKLVYLIPRIELKYLCIHMLQNNELLLQQTCR